MIIKNLTKNLYISLLIVFLVYALDRISKTYIIYLDKINNGSDIFLSSYLNISLIWNEGIAFGLFSFEKSHFYNVLSSAIAFVILILITMAVKNTGFKRYSLLIIIGGALGNLFDRVFFSAVPDFIDFHIGEFHWFIFNVSDIFITLGVIGMIILELIDKDKNYDDKKI
jgi:signal peptidase II